MVWLPRQHAPTRPFCDLEVCKFIKDVTILEKQDTNHHSVLESGLEEGRLGLDKGI